jgi:hypothetical protein
MVDALAHVAQLQRPLAEKEKDMSRFIFMLTALLAVGACETPMTEMPSANVDDQETEAEELEGVDTTGFDAVREPY